MIFMGSKNAPIKLIACVGLLVFQFSFSSMAENYIQPTGPVEGISQERLKELRAKVTPLIYRQFSSDFGGVVTCSKALCDRFGVPVPEGMEIDSNEEIGVELRLQIKPEWITEKPATIPPSHYTCQFIVMFPSEWDVYTADGSSDWIEVELVTKSSLVRSLRFDDKIFRRKNVEKINNVHSYRSIKSVDKNRNITNSLSALEIHKEVAPGLGVAIVLDIGCDKIKSGDSIELYIPNQSAYPHGPDRSRGKLTDNYFKKITLPARFSQEMKRFTLNK